MTAIITPNIGASLSGKIGMQVLESTLLSRVRRESAARHGLSQKFNQRFGYCFDGSTESFLRLHPWQRLQIERDVVRHIQEHEYDWKHSEQRIKYVQPTKPNLILNSGLNRFFAGNNGLGTFTRYCALGTGTATPAVTDTLLGAEVKRHTSYLTTSGACGTTFDTASFLMRRTYDFSVETVDRNYTEIGFGDSATANSTLNIRSLLSGTATVLIGQQARAVHELTVNCGNTTRQSGTVGITGWPVSPATTTDAEWQWQNLGLTYVNTSGNSTGSNNIFEPILGQELAWKCYTSITLSTWLSASTRSGALSNNPTSDTRVGTCTWTTYTTDSFQRSVIPNIAFTPSIWSSTAIRGFSYGRVTYDFGYVITDADVLVVRFNEAQTKDDLHSLKLVGFTFSLTRTP